MNDNELNKIKKRADSATRGPWYTGCLTRYRGDPHNCNCTYIFDNMRMGSICRISVDNGKKISEGGNDCPPLDEAIANMEFIANAREDVPILVEEIKRLNNKIKTIADHLYSLNLPGCPPGMDDFLDCKNRDCRDCWNAFFRRRKK